MDLSQLRDQIYELWSAKKIVIEPPRGTQRQYRISHPENGSQPAPSVSVDGGPAKTASDALLTICGQLANSFHEVKHPEAKEELRRLLQNLGAIRVEAEGACIPFLGRWHLCESDILPGDLVRVAESGWLLQNCPADYLLSKARVVSVEPQTSLSHV